MIARALVVALAIVTPVAAFLAGAGLFQGWTGWRASGSGFLEDETTRSNVVIGVVAAIAWGAFFVAARGIRSSHRLVLLASFLGMVVAWFWIGIRELIVL